jgi:hypothetical protein
MIQTSVALLTAAVSECLGWKGCSEKDSKILLKWQGDIVVVKVEVFGQASKQTHLSTWLKVTCHENKV